MMEEHSYDDIIHQPHHTSRKRPRMALSHRAAQFAPFAALTGYEAMVVEAARLTDRRAALSEEELLRLNQQLHRLMDDASAHPRVVMVIFEEDASKEGGAYRTVEGLVRRIDDVRQEVVLTDQRTISFGQICWIQPGDDAPERL